MIPLPYRLLNPLINLQQGDIILFNALFVVATITVIPEFWNSWPRNSGNFFSSFNEFRFQRECIFGKEDSADLPASILVNVTVPRAYDSKKYGHTDYLQASLWVLELRTNQLVILITVIVIFRITMESRVRSYLILSIFMHIVTTLALPSLRYDLQNPFDPSFRSIVTGDGMLQPLYDSWRNTPVHHDLSGAIVKGKSTSDKHGAHSVDYSSDSFTKSIPNDRGIVYLDFFSTSDCDGGITYSSGMSSETCIPASEYSKPLFADDFYYPFHREFEAFMLTNITGM